MLLLRARDTLTGTLIAEWQPFATQWTEDYNAPGTLSATVKLSAWLAAGAAPLRTFVQLIDTTSGTMWFSGPVWSADPDLTTKLVTLQVAGWLSVLKHRVNRTDLTYTAVDQATIAAGLVAEAQRDTQAGGANHRDLSISVAFVGTTGVARDRTYLASERKNIGQALAELAACTNGFRFAIADVPTTGTAFSRRLLISAVSAATTTVLRHGSNMEAKVTITAEAMASDVDFLAGPSKTAYTLVVPVPTFPGLDDVIAASDITSVATITDVLARRLADGIAPLNLVAATLHPKRDANSTTVGLTPDSTTKVSVNIGDQVRVVVSELSVDQTMLVVGITRPPWATPSPPPSNSTDWPCDANRRPVSP
jgi:hypothetical protein